MADVSLKLRPAEAPGRARRQFRWAPGGKPVAVRFELDMIERMAAEVVDSFRAVTARGSEIGGILLGRVDGESPRTVVVEDYELVPCAYERGPLYQLTEQDAAALRDALAAHRQGGRRAVGYFRSHTRKRLALDGDDLAVFDAHFPAPHDLFLLVRPFVKEANVGCVFARANGALAAGVAAEETFPFEAAELLKPPFASQVGEPAAAEPRPPAPVIRISEAKAAVERAAAAKEPAPPAAAPPPPRLEMKPPAPPPPATRPDVKPPAPAPPAPVERRAEPKPELKPEPQGASQPLPAPEPERPAGGRGKLWIALAALAVCLAGGWFLFRPRSHAPAAPAVSGEPTLRVERSGGQLLLTWDRDAAWVRGAQKAVLSIFDGPQKEDVQLDLGQLKTGSIVYLPVTNDVSFRMEVTNGNSGRTVVESVRVLGTRPSPMPLEPSPAAVPAPVPGAPAPAGGAPVAGAPAPAGAAQPSPAETASPAVTFTPPPGSLAARLRPAEPGDLPEPPAIADTGSAPGLPGLPAEKPAAPAPMRPSAPATAPAKVSAPSAPPVSAAPASARAVATDPVLLHRTDPVYPSIAKQARISGVVRLQLTIGKDGRVKNVSVIGGHALLRQSAVEAARQWTYRPSLLAGQPVESTLMVQMVFTLAR